LLPLLIHAFGLRVPTSTGLGQGQRAGGMGVAGRLPDDEAVRVGQGAPLVRDLNATHGDCTSPRATQFRLFPGRHLAVVPLKVKGNVSPNPHAHNNMS